MNDKVVLGIIGVAIVVGGVIYFISRTKTGKDTNVNSDYDDVKETVNIVNHTEIFESDNSVTLNHVKADAAEKMSKRHGEAEKIVKESVGNIFGDTEVEKTKNEAAMKKVFEDLDNI